MTTLRRSAVVVALLLAVLAPPVASEIKDTAADETQKAWLEEYSEKDGVVVKESGLMYRILEEGTGGTPDWKTSCRCHCEGRLTTNWPDGDTFESSIERGQTSPCRGGFIKAWTEANLIMPVGSKWELVIPPEIGYGAKVKMGGRIPAHSTLVFTMELLSCDGITDEPQNAWVEEYSQKDGVVVKESGLIYRILEEGTGSKPDLKTRCKCHCEGRLTTNWPDGETFESSIERGRPSFCHGGFIKAWPEADLLMPVGSKWELVIPPEIAYGYKDTVPRYPTHSTLVFTMELLSCEFITDEL